MAVSGQVGVVDGALVEGGVQAEARQALANLVSVLATQGATLAHVVKTTVYLRDIGEFPAMNKIYAEVFGEYRPARATVGVAALPLGALFEVDAWAYLG